MKKAGLLLSLITILINTNAQEYTTVVKEFKDHDENVFSVAFSPDGKLLASGSEDKTMLLYNLETDELLHTFEGHFSTINDIAFNPKGKYIFSAGDKTIRIWKPDGTYINKIRGHKTYIWSISLTPDGNKIASGSFEEDFYLWDILNTEKLETYSEHTKSVLAVDIDPDGDYIVSGSLDKSIKLWDIKAANVIKTGYGHAGNIYDIKFSPDRKYIITASRDNTLKLWDAMTLTQIRTFNGHKEAVMAFDFTPDGSNIISASYDKTLRLWEVPTGKCIYVYNDHEDAINTVCFSPDGEYFASGDNDDKVLVFKLDHRIFVDYAYKNEMQKEMEEAGYLDQKRDNESRSDYKARQEKAGEFNKMLYKKYYKMYKEKLKNMDKKDKGYKMHYEKD